MLEKLKKTLFISLCVFLFFSCTFNAMQNIALGVAFALSVYIAYKEHRFNEIYSHKIFKFMAALWIALLISSIFSDNITAGITETLKVYVNRMLTFFMVLFIAKDDIKDRRDYLLWCGIASLVVTSIVAIWAFFHGNMRPGGLTGHPIRLGSYYCLYIPIMFMVISDGTLIKELKKKLAFCIATLICLGGFLVNNTRGAWLAVGITCTIFIFILGLKNKKILAGGIVTLLIFGGIIWSVPRFNSRAFSTNKAIADTSGGQRVTDERWHIWRSAVYMLKDRPVLGYGPNSFEKEYNERYIMKHGWIEGNLGHAHNIYLHLWCEGGIISLLGYIALMLKIIYDGFIAYFKQRSVYGLMMAGAVISVMLNGVTEFNAVVFKVGFLLFSYCYLIMSSTRGN